MIRHKKTLIPLLLITLMLFSCSGGNNPAREKEIPDYKPQKDNMKSSDKPQLTPDGILFTFKDNYAKKVSIVGDFNNWNHMLNPMTKNIHGIWKVIIPLKQGEYSYKINVDGQWILDPKNSRKVSNELGDQRSFIRIDQDTGGVMRSVTLGLTRGYPPIPQEKGILFTYKDLKARSVNLGGDFNDWNRTSIPMQQNENGVWSVVLPLFPGEYQYKFNADNIWISDPDNENKKFDEFAQPYSILRVTNRFADTENIPTPVDLIPWKFRYKNKNLPSRLRIAVTGDFNNWDEDLHYMLDTDQDKIWEGIIELPPGNYLYRYHIRIEGDEETFLDPYNHKQKTAGDGQPASYLEIFHPPGRHLVRFTFRNYLPQKIHDVYLTGDFNHFSRQSDRMEYDPLHDYWYTVIDLPPGTYRYKYYIDGNWELDISNPDTIVDHAGQTYSIITIP